MGRDIEQLFKSTDRYILILKLLVILPYYYTNKSLLFLFLSVPHTCMKIGLYMVYNQRASYCSLANLTECGKEKVQSHENFYYKVRLSTNINRTFDFDPSL